MGYVVRTIAGNNGAAIEICSPNGDRRPMAVFSGSDIEDFRFVDARMCLLASKDREILLLDCEAREVVSRVRLKNVSDLRVLPLQSARQALVFSKSGSRFFVLSLPDLKTVFAFGAAERLDENHYRLVDFADDASFERANWFHNLPFYDAPIRRISPNNSRAAVARADGKVVMPIGFKKLERDFCVVRSQFRGKVDELIQKLHRVHLGVCELDLERRVCSFNIIHDGVQGNAAIQAISPDGRYAISVASDLALVPEVKDHGSSGLIRRAFGRRQPPSYAFALDIRDLSSTPTRSCRLPVQRLADGRLVKGQGAHLKPDEVEPVLSEILALLPGLAAAKEGRLSAWKGSAAQKLEDSIYLQNEAPREGPRKPKAYDYLIRPEIFGPTMRALMTEIPGALSAMPWQSLSDRQAGFMAKLGSAFEYHARSAAYAFAWTDRDDTFVILTRQGTVREVHVEKGVGPEYVLTPLTKPDRNFSWDDIVANEETVRAELSRLHGRTFALEYHGNRLEFDLPETGDFSMMPPKEMKNLATRIVMDKKQFYDELKLSDSLTSKLRPDFIKIKSLSADNVIAGVHKLADVVRRRFDEIVVHGRWEPTLVCQERAVREENICKILLELASAEAEGALSALLDAYLSHQGAERPVVWHLDDTTPACAPTAFALLQMTGRVSENVERFFANRDMDHDSYTVQQFEKFELERSQWAARDMLRLRLRLAVQDIGTGNFGKDLFKLYGLTDVAEGLGTGEYEATAFADLVAEVVNAQAPLFSWATPLGVKGVIKMLADGLSADRPAIAELKQELEKRAA